VLSFLAFFSRASVGSGTVLTLLLLAGCIVGSRLSIGAGRFQSALLSPIRALCAWSRPPGVTHALLAAGCAASIFVAFVSINHAKFATWLDATPLHMYLPIMREPQRLARCEGKQMSLANVRTGLKAYLSPDSIQIAMNFPWVYPARSADVMPEARYDIIEPFTSITATMPALLALALLGLFAARRRCASGATATIAILGALAGGASVCAADALTERYLHDFFPLLVLSGALGLHVLRELPSRPIRHCLLAVGVLLVLLGIYANLSVAIVYQRVIVWGVPKQTQVEFQQWCDAVDRFTGAPPPRPAPRLSTRK
jgi:hypothetical protein